MNHDIDFALQSLQLEFDKAHGFAEIGALGMPSPPANRGARSETGAAAFAALALAGECGEIANAIKKAVRAEHMDQDPKAHLDVAKGELADAFAYLLKLAAVLNTDLATEYLETVALNCLRFAITGQENGMR